MDAGSLAALTREGLMLVAVVGGPLLAGLLIAGFAMGVLQATTQINDPAVGFVPRVVVGGLLTWALGAWMLERLAQFLVHAVQRGFTP